MESRLPGAIAWTALFGWSFDRGLTSEHALHLAGRMWSVWVVLWMALAFFSKSTKRRETRGERLQHILPIALGCLLLFDDRFGGWLARRVIPENPVLLAVLLAFTAAGLLFSFWPRFALGRNWSSEVTIKTGHELVRKGPYRRIRHPIYTGLLAAFLSTALLQGLVSGLLAFLLVAGGIYRKALREERFLAQEFGEGFAEHRKHTGMFLPRLL
jgi:protein-S-isoprenylcysteine O-methyltransferase Ste14